MNQFIKNNVNYDSKFDILNVYFGPTTNSVGDEDVDNIIEFRDVYSNQLTRLMVIHFKRIFEEEDFKLLKIKENIDFDQIYKKYILNSNKKDRIR